MEAAEQLIGITRGELAHLISDAYESGYQRCKEDNDRDEWLMSRTEIIKFLCPGDSVMSNDTFERKRRRGEYGAAIVGVGMRAKCKKSELMNAIRQYQYQNM